MRTTLQRAALCAVTAVATALTGQPTSSGPREPSSLPDRIVLTWAGDPATTMSVTWRTDAKTTKSIAQIAPATDGPEFKNARTVTGEVRRFDGDSNIHTVRFRGLQPATEYAYRVGDGTHASGWTGFKTAANGPAPLTFLYMGDAQTGLLSHWARAVRVGLEKAPDARFAVYAGDLVNRGARDEEWGEWFHAAAPLLSTIPSLPAIGDHEYTSTFGLSGGLPDEWEAHFDLPRNGLEGLEETSYYLDVQGVRVVVLNSSKRTAEQARWLDQILGQNGNQWTVIVLHHPVFTAAEGRNNKGRRELWQPVIDKHGVDLVLQGHDHVYTRSGLTGGTVYVTAVAGAKAYNVARQPWMNAVAEKTSTIQTIRIEGGHLKFESWSLEGKLVDAFELLKSPDNRNKLVDSSSR